MKKKLIGAILSFLLVISSIPVFASCGKKENTHRKVDWEPEATLTVI